MFNGTTVKSAVDYLTDLPDRYHPNGFEWFLRVMLTLCGMAAVGIVILAILILSM